MKHLCHMVDTLKGAKPMDIHQRMSGLPDKWTNIEYYLNLPHLQPYFHQASNGSSRYANKDGLPSIP